MHKLSNGAARLKLGDFYMLHSNDISTKLRWKMVQEWKEA